MADWLTPVTARADWADATGIGDAELGRYLEAAKIKVLAYAPALPIEAAPPANYVLAQLAQARDLWNALHAKTTTPGEMGLDAYAVTSYPMSWHIQDLLRPNTPRPNRLVG